MANLVRPESAALEQAAQWYAVLRSETVAEPDRQDWQRWLDASPTHRLAWQRVESVRMVFESLANASHRGAVTACLGTLPRDAVSAS